VVGGLEVLDSLERDHDIDGSVSEWQCAARALDKTSTLARSVAGTRVSDGRAIEIDADDLPRRLGQVGGSIAFATGRIEHALAHDEVACESIAMPVLVRDFSATAGQKALTRESEIGGHAEMMGCQIGQLQPILPDRSWYPR